MASAKKVSKAKVQASKAKGAKGKAAKKNAAPPLTTEDKQRLIKPIDGFAELTERFAAAWSERRALKVSGINPSKLLRALEQAKKAAAKEDATRRKLEEKLRPLTDARLRAEHAAWKMVLDAYAVAKALARVEPDVGHAFAFMGDALTRKPRKTAEQAGEGANSGDGATT